MKLENPSNNTQSKNELIGKGFDPESSMGALSWFSIMNNISEIFSNPEFREAIESGKYNLLIADDSSGRVPALIFQKVINAICTEKNIPHPKLLFIPGQRLSTDQNISQKISDHINQYLQKVNGPQAGTSALVITNVITSGKTLGILSDALKKSDIDCDIATTSLEVSHSSSDKSKNELEDMLGRKIYTAKNFETSLTSGMNKKAYSHGVTKNPGEMVSQKIQGVQDHINTARKMVDKISEEIIRQVHSADPVKTDQERFTNNMAYITKYWSLTDE